MNLLFISVHYNFQNFLCTPYVPAFLATIPRSSQYCLYSFSNSRFGSGFVPNMLEIWTYHHGGLFPLLVRRSPYMLVEHLHTTIPIMADIAIAFTTSGTIAA